MDDFPRAGKAGKPQYTGRLALEVAACVFADIDMLQMNILRTTQREMQHARADRLVTHAIDENESAGLAIILIGVERNRAVEADIANTDRVQRKLFCSKML